MTKLVRVFVNGTFHSARNIDWPASVGGGIELSFGWVEIVSSLESPFGRMVYTRRAMTAEEEARASGQLALW